MSWKAKKYVKNDSHAPFGGRSRGWSSEIFFLSGQADSLQLPPLGSALGFNFSLLTEGDENGAFLEDIWDLMLNAVDRFCVWLEVSVLLTQCLREEPFISCGKLLIHKAKSKRISLIIYKILLLRELLKIICKTKTKTTLGRCFGIESNGTQLFWKLVTANHHKLAMKIILPLHEIKTFCDSVSEVISKLARYYYLVAVPK